MVEGLDLISRDIPVSKKRKQPPINSQMWCNKYDLGFVLPVRDKDLPELSFGTAIQSHLTDLPMRNGEMRIIRMIEDHPLSGTPETIDFPNAVRIQADQREMNECMTVLLPIMVAQVNLEVKTSDTETSGEEDHHETLNAEARSAIKRVMAIRDIEGIVSRTGSIVVETKGVTMMADLESVMKATGGVNGNLSLTSGVGTVETGMVLVETV